MISVSYLEMLLIVVDSILIGLVLSMYRYRIKAFFSRPAPVVHNHYCSCDEEDV